MKKSSGSDEPRRPKFREVSSRYLHNIPSSPQIPIENYSSNPSPLWQINKSSSSTTDTRKHRSHDSGLLRKLWPSAGKSSRNGEKEVKNSDNSSMFLNRQKSCTSVFSRFDTSPQINGTSTSSSSSKENHKPFFGGSMRYTGKFKFPGRSSSSSSPVIDEDDLINPGRLSVDETALRQRSFGGRSTDVSDIQDSGSECSDYGSNTSLGSPFIGRNSPASYMSPTVSSSFRMSGLEASSNDQRHRRGTSESNIATDNFKKTNVKNNVKRANSLTAPSKRSSPPVQQSNLKPPSPPHMFPKPPTSPSKGKLPPTRSKGVGSFISMGLDLFKHKKPYPHSTSGSGTVGVSSMNTVAESVHQLRMLHNRLVQWRYTNARGANVNESLTTQAESKLLYTYDALVKLQSSVLQKRLQLEKEKLEIKLNNILLSQIKPLESWSDLERQHQLAVLMTTDSLHSAICRIPLIEGAVVEPETASLALRYASDLAVSIESMLSTYSPEVEKNVAILAELAEVAAQEKSILDECLELSRFILKLEMEEWSLNCQAVQMKSLQQRQPDIPA